MNLPILPDLVVGAFSQMDGECDTVEVFNAADTDELCPWSHCETRGAKCRSDLLHCEFLRSIHASTVIMALQQMIPRLQHFPVLV